MVNSSKPPKARRRRWAVLSVSVRAKLWPLPALAVVVAVLAGVGLTLLDKHVDSGLPQGLTDYLFGGGADAAREVLSAVAGSLITVTSLTFSLTVVTLQLASSQFSPRLLRTFTSDRFVHATLALFLATFVFALTVLRTVRAENAGTAEFVPQISVTVAFVLALASVLALVLFLAHLAREIRVETMLRNVHAEARETLQRELADADEAPGNEELPAPAENAHTLVAESSGFLTSIDEIDLLHAAIAEGAILLVHRAPGDRLVSGTPLAQVWSLASEDPLSSERIESIAERVKDGVGIGFERTPAQDISYGLRQITDVANKALSPGVNDPTTAIHAIGHSSSLLCELAQLKLGNRVLTDDDGRARVILHRPDLPELLELAVAQPRRYGASDPAVLSGILSLLRELAWRARSATARQAVADQLARIRRTAAAQGFDSAEQQELDRSAAEVQNALHDRWW